jgi:membrane dipeptidase
MFRRSQIGSDIAGRRSPVAGRPFLFPFLFTVLAASPALADTLAARAARLHGNAIVVDTHEDVPWELREKWVDLAVGGATKHVDIARLKKGGVGAVFFAVFTPGELADKGQAAHVAFELSDLIDRVVAAHPDVFAPATTVADIRAARQSGRIAILKGIEGGHAIEDSLGLLRVFYRLGVRYMTLTHTNTNDWADSLGKFTEQPYDPGKYRKHGGLTSFGKQVVAEMNRLGMAVDISHVSPETLRDVLAVSKAPPFASHSSCRALTDNPRNLTDEQIAAIAKAGGVVMINASSSFLDDASLAAARKNEHGAGTTLSRYVDHIEHALKIAPGAVGLGTDFDGIEDPPRDFADVSFLPKLTEELLRRGHSDEEVRGVLGESFLRYLARVERASSR